MPRFTLKDPIWRYEQTRICFSHVVGWNNIEWVSGVECCVAWGQCSCGASRSSPPLSVPLLHQHPMRYLFLRVHAGHLQSLTVTSEIGPIGVGNGCWEHAEWKVTAARGPVSIILEVCSHRNLASWWYQEDGLALRWFVRWDHLNSPVFYTYTSEPQDSSSPSESEHSLESHFGLILY